MLVLMFFVRQVGTEISSPAVVDISDTPEKVLG